MTEHTGWRMETRGVRDVMVPTSRPQTLAEFLLARIAEDEAWADRAGSHNGKGVYEKDNYGCLLVEPGRVIAECEAKRRIVDLHNPCDDWSYGDASWCPELRALAQPYADHPDFREEWRA